MKTVLHAYNINTAFADGIKDYDALCANLKQLGLKVSRSPFLPTEDAYNFQIRTKAISGQIIELDTNFLFSNQWNTQPIAGVSESGLRLMEWHEYIYPAENIHEGSWLSVSEEMRQAQRTRSRCGYCGNQLLEGFPISYDIKTDDGKTITHDA